MWFYELISKVMAASIEADDLKFLNNIFIDEEDTFSLVFISKIKDGG